MSRKASFIRLSLLLSAVIFAVGAAVVPAASFAGAQPDHARRSTIVLCAAAGTTHHKLRRTKIILSRRVHHGFHFAQAKVTLSGDCITVSLGKPLSWIRWLAEDISTEGHFGIGISYPDKSKILTAGETVRYKSDPITSANSSLPEVQVVIGRPAFVGFSAKLVTRSGFDYVGVHMTPRGATKLCSFTEGLVGGTAVVVLDHQVITDESVTVKICGGKLLTGFPKVKSLDKPLGPRQLVALMHSGTPLPVPLTFTLHI